MPKILVVDNDRSMATALEARLRAAGYGVLTAHCSDAARQIVLRERPNLIILDVDLPDYSGLEFHECLMFAGRGRDIPVIYLTANDSPASRIVALRQGAYDFITKPFDTQRLVTSIEYVLATSAA